MVGALWACAKLVFDLTKELNNIRDSILSVPENRTTETIEKRYHSLWNDWLPLAGAVVIVTLGFGVISALAPLTVSGSRPIAIWIVCEFVATFSGFMFIGWIVTGIQDFRFMKRNLENESRNK